VKIAAAQISCALGDIDATLHKIHDLSSRAKSDGAEVIVFPEMADTGYSMSIIQKQATTWTSGAVPEVQHIAKMLSIALVSGVSERENSTIYNSQVVIDSGGEIVAKYRKIHLFTVTPIEEHKCFSPGHELVTFFHGRASFRTQYLL